ncbi:SGNH/GDSL hydrolase family protein [Gracilibacillus dipsosauri]|uniref:SGNH hydrolase-type esterase domain-containing protein n=1 Tax=Gracilibacillus dipsosauri TaxID=178340 RepID=A0A317KT01_9BACI|nr:SGNH/GDSL hydrolase family protein [Gracilibacillus dipsosauri]PWU66587.1 hypothetical protein DLJ74_19390 [Gracilibacillus dipsosauri]
MKRKHIIITSLLLLAIIPLISIFIYITNDREMVTVAQSQTETFSFANDNEINIAVVGDSWVANEKLDQYIKSELEKSNIDSEIISYGYPGRKTKDIYQKITSEPAIKKVDLMVIVAGVNDSAGHIGKDFYSHHMKNIVTFANINSIYPFVLELPEFSIETNANRFLSQVKHTIYRYLFDKGKLDNINEYRSELETTLSNSDLLYSIIPFGNIIDDYSSSKDLYIDPWHLNDKGNETLGTYIGQFIAKQLEDKASS